MMITKTEKEKAHSLPQKKKHMAEHYHLLNPKQRLALSIPGIRVWMLQGQQLVRENKLTPTNFLHITTFLTSLSSDETKLVFNIVNLKLFTDITEDIGKGVYGFFKTKNSINSERKVAKERCERRLISLEELKLKAACTEQLSPDVARIS